MLGTRKLDEILFHLGFATLFALSILLYKERLFADASYYFFHAINSGFFHVEHGRLVLAFSQITPLIAYYLYLPLKLVVLAASIGHEFYYYGLFLLVYYGLKDKPGAITILLIHVIGQLWLYYSPMLEICYGAVLAVFFYSLLKSNKYVDDKWMIFLLLSQWFVMTSHPENFILIGLAIAYDILNRGWQKRVHLITLVFFVIGFVAEVLTFSEYERGHADIIQEGSPASFLNLFDPIYFQKVAQVFLIYYPELIVLFAFSLFYTLLKKRFLIAILFTFSLLFVLFLVNEAAVANQFTRYYESMYNPLVFIVVFFFLYEVYQKVNERIKIGLGILLAISIFARIFWIWDYGQDLRIRMDQMDRLTDHAQKLYHGKLLIKEQNYTKKYAMVTWANPIETLIFSAIDGKESSVSIATEGDYYYNKNNAELNDSNYLFRRFEIEPLSFLNPRYFKLNPLPYKKLNTSEFKLPLEDYFSAVKIEVIGNELEMTAGDTAYFLVKLENSATEILPSSLETKLYLSYHWYQDGTLVNWDGIRTPLELDLLGEYSQDIEVIAPQEPGVYELIPDIVVEDRAWFNLSQRYQVKVKAHI